MKGLKGLIIAESLMALFFSAIMIYMTKFVNLFEVQIQLSTVFLNFFLYQFFMNSLFVFYTIPRLPDFKTAERSVGE